MKVSMLFYNKFASLSRNLTGFPGFATLSVIFPIQYIKECFPVNRALSPRALVFIAVLGALSSLLMAFEFPLPFAPAYMKFEISDLPALFAGFFLGPLAGAFTEVIKILLKLVLVGSSSAFVGEGMNLLCALAYVLPATIFYHLHRTKSGALTALLLSTVVASLFAVVANRYLAIPMYVRLYKIPLGAILKMASATNPLVHSLTDFLLLTILPFNLLKYTVVSFLPTWCIKKPAWPCSG
jgi:riboflavin transporter